MDSRHIGYRELIYIETEKVSVTIKGDASHPSAPGVEYEDCTSSIKIRCKNSVHSVKIKNEAAASQSGVLRTAPLFFEQKQYEIIIEGVEDIAISFWHSSRHIREKITSSSKKYNIVSGILNFGNEIGYSDLIIKVNGEEYLKITIEVFPTKISYQADYKAIVSDVTAEIYNLIFDFLKKTYRGYKQSGNRKSSPAEFFSVIMEIYSKLLKAADKILKQPHHLLQSESEILRSDKIRQINTRTLRWIERHPECVERDKDRFSVSYAMACKKNITFDNKENRLAKHMLKSTVSRLISLKQQYTMLFRDSDPEIINKIDIMIENLKRRIHSSFFAEVKDTYAKTGMSLVFAMAPGYRELYKYYLMLQRGLDVSGDIFNISLKDLAVLYEYWCFIKLNSILKEKYDLVSQDIIRAEGNRLTLALVKGQNSRVRYRNYHNGESIILSYNPKAVNLPTVSQRPDNVLTLQKNSIDSQNANYEYIFDAKYKIDPSIKGSYYNKVISSIPGPKEEDINTMHRYRDAIVSDHNASRFEHTMFGAYVLFPYSDEEKYKAHRFYKSIDKVNIGGLPFLPSSTSLVTELLDELIESSPQTILEKTTLPKGIEQKLKKIDWSKRDVLIGALKNREQLQICRDNFFYHIPVDKISDSKLPIHYVAIYQSKNIFGQDSGIYMYGEVLRSRVVRRSEIEEIPKNSDKLYYRFDIKEWKMLHRPIKVKEYAETAMFTNLFLLQHSFNVPELQIQSEEEYRLYSELKRMLNSDVINEDNGNLYFKYGDYIIDNYNNRIRLFKDKKRIGEYSAESFNRKPNYWMKQIIKVMR